MRILLVVITVLLLTHSLMGQKTIRKTIINSEKQSIQVDTNNCYLVTLETSKESELKVEASIEGEYEKDLAVKIEEDGANVLVSADFLPNFVAPNDKLSAHKVISISLKITIPSYCNVNVYGTNSNVLASGKYKYLKVSSDTGDCSIVNVVENVEVKTQKGTINITAKEGKITAESTYGKVQLAKIPTGNSSYRLVSVEGDIYVNKTD